MPVAEPFLRVEGLSKAYGGHAALRRAGFTLEKGRTLGLVGVSGSGKSTLARCLAGFERPDAGTMLLAGSALGGRASVPPVQLIFQDAAASLNPRLTAEEIVAEPLVIQRRGTAAWRRKAAGEWLETVGISRPAADKPALASSGGERQRLAIARALAAEPKLLIVDESLSGLDVMLQAQIGRLLADLRRRLDLTCILITHDLGLAGRLADEIAVMDAGEIVEQAPAGQVMAAPRHERTRELVEAGRVLALDDDVSTGQNGPGMPSSYGRREPGPYGDRQTGGVA
jgi:peptide/nickel transport system ATP-binding protein